MSGLLGYGACYEATHEADLLLLLGTDFPYDSALPQIDHDPARLGRRTPLELAIHGDVAATLRAVLPLVKQKTDRSLLDRMLQARSRARARHRRLHPQHRAPCPDPP
jgi:pyruvate dehydrogenase (quinone)